MAGVELKEHLEQQIVALDKRVDARFIALDTALKLQAEKDAKHFETLNGHQEQLQRDRNLYLPRETYAADKASRTDAISLWVSIVSLIVAICTLALTASKLMR